MNSTNIVFCCYRSYYSCNIFHKYALYLALLLSGMLAAYTPSRAQSPHIEIDKVNDLKTNENAHLEGFPAGSLVLMADGTEKKIEDIKTGELVAAYDPVLEDYIINKVTDFRTYAAKPLPITTVMLILEELSASLQLNGGLAGVSLQAGPTCEVYTKAGPKQVRQLTENDLLYCYDDNAHRFLCFRVYEINANSHETEITYSLQTEQSNCIINSTVVLQTQDF